MIGFHGYGCDAWRYLSGVFVPFKVARTGVKTD
jgi:hypothetical protein